MDLPVEDRNEVQAGCTQTKGLLLEIIQVQDAHADPSVAAVIDLVQHLEVVRLTAQHGRHLGTAAAERHGPPVPGVVVPHAHRDDHLDLVRIIVAIIKVHVEHARAAPHREDHASTGGTITVNPAAGEHGVSPSFGKVHKRAFGHASGEELDRALESDGAQHAHRA